MLDAYLTRIGVARPQKATLSALRELHSAHVSAIPFENLDILLGAGISLDLDHIYAKLVGKRRGGYCFEQNTLFLNILREVGFVATPMEARVRIALRWRDMDMLGHLNQSVYHELLEEARAALFAPLFEQGGWSFVLVRVELDHRREVRRDHLGRLVGRASFYVDDVAGPLLDGELDRARAWGEELAERNEASHS